MGISVHEAAARWGLDEWMKTAEGANALSVYVQGLKEGRWDQDYVDSIGQIARAKSHRWPYEQVVAFAMVHSRLAAGRVVRVLVSTRGTPHPDRCRDENQAGLDDLLGPFTAHVDPSQNNEGQDGYLRWDAPIQVEQVVAEGTGPDGLPHRTIKVMWAQPGQIPLEIGTTMPSKTLSHFDRERGVARWPYGHDFLHVYLDTSWYRLTPVADGGVFGEPESGEIFESLRETEPLPQQEASET